MQSPFRKLSIRQKLISFLFGTTGTALLLFCIIFTAVGLRVIERSKMGNLEVLADAVVNLTGSSSASGWAHQALEALQADKEIEKAVIFSVDGRPLAIYSNPALRAAPDLPVTVGTTGNEFFLRNGIIKLGLHHPILVDGKRAGTLYLLYSLKDLTGRLGRAMLLLLVALGGLLLLAFIVSPRLQRLITRSLSDLGATARKAAELGDYRIRLEQEREDETGDVIDDFNAMLDMIRQRDTELSEHRYHLEMLVEKRTEQLRRKCDEALAAAQAKREFLANMSHEIRTPMNGIIGVLSLLKDAPLSEEYRRLLQTATRSADSLLLIINDILDFSKIEAGRIDFESIGFDLRDLMEETTLLFMEAANMKQIDLFCFIPTDIDTKVQGDPTRLRQVLTNLLSNAVKFTEKGEVVLQVALAEKQEGRQVLRFSVKDTGIGISPEAMKVLFTKFTQADGSTTRKYGGTGLGLSVCKQLIEMQNGEIGVDSQVGKATIFWFTLPMRVGEGVHQEFPGEILSGRRFLIVDDNATNRMIIEHYLKSADTEIRSCDTGDRALAAIREMAGQQKPVDTVLLDYHMPGKDGLQVAAEIRREFGEQAPAMVLLSSEGRVWEKAMAVGIRTIIYKPIRLNQFYKALSLIPKSEEQPGAPAQARDEGPVLYGKILLVDDEVINQKVGVALLKKIGIDSKVAGNGREAVRMVEEEQYDLILMDIQMPELSGLEATEVIRKKELHNGLPRIPIIAMTANVLESTRQRCLAIGMDDFIAKPIKPDLLREQLRPWLAVRSPGSVRAGGPLSPAPPPSGTGEQRGVDQERYDGRIWDKRKALRFVGGDELLLRELAALFLRRNALLLENVEKAIGAKDAVALHDAAHAYKGAVNHFSATKLSESAFALEQKGGAGDFFGTESLLAALRNGASSLEEELREYTRSSGN